MTTPKKARPANISQADCRAWVLAKIRKDKAAKEMEVLAAKLKAAMGNLEAYEVDIFTVHSRSETYNSFDSAAFRKAEPDLADQYVVEKSRQQFDIVYDAEELLLQS